MKPFWIYPIYTSILALILILLVPRKDIKKLAFQSILLGGVADFIILNLFIFIIKKNIYINFYPFGAGKIAFFLPIAWTIWFIIFFYLLPEKKISRYIYITVSAAYSTFFANVLYNLDIIQWKYEKVFLPFLIYICWFFTAIYLKEKIEKSIL
ncbi:MAG: hypothetical protein GX175_00875 [Halanaerobiaceae bacterium]|nr:hypothetical protein [Halanaerobiaceae bacterium]